MDRSESALLPSFTLAVKPFDWLQPFVGYSKSFRPPTVMESFMPSAHANERGTWSPNPNLDPERAETWEIGANIMADGLLWADDALRLKVVGFYREVENYIAIGRTYIPETDRPYNAPVNLNATTYMKGLEIEANYDARTWYLGGSFTWNETNWAETYTSHNGYDDVIGPQTAVIFVQPARRLVLDGGVRLFDESLTLGARMTDVGPSKPEIGTLASTGNYTLDGYTTFDVYASYAFNDSIKLRAAVTNLMDKAYVSATGVTYYAAPGRTATISLQVKF